MTLKKLAFLVIVMIVMNSVIFYSGVNAQAAWWNENWQYRQKVTINNDKIEGSVNFVNFPVLIEITDQDNPLFGKANANAYDIVFVDSSGTKLDHEIVRYSDTETKFLEAYVEVPTLSIDTEIYMYYGNNGAADQSNSAGTWSNNYKLVYHMDDLTTSTVEDSAGLSNGSKASENKPQETTTGQIDRAQSFTSDTGYVDTNQDYDFSGGGEFTASMWTKDTSPGNKYLIVQTHAIGGYSSDWILGYQNGGVWMRSMTIDGNNIISDGEWHYLCFTFDGTNTIALYIDGDLKDSRSDISGFGGISSVKIHSRGDLGGNYNGEADEIRLSTTKRSADWIKTAYNNQHDAPAFYVLSDEEESVDENPPTWKNQKQHYDAIFADGIDINELEAEGTDETGLLQAVLATNESGTWVNITDGTYGSPYDCGGVATPVTTVFDWSSSTIAEGSTIAWKIWYEDTSINKISTDTILFNIKVSDIPPQECSDGTLHGECSATKPLYCDDGNLINNCDACGCSNNQTCTANICINTICAAGTNISCGSNIGVCQQGYKICNTNGVWGECIGGVLSSTEVCDNLDNDCDGQVDESGCLCVSGETRECGGSEVGICKKGLSVCSGGMWSECYGEVGPIDEICNQKDDNCDGKIDNVGFQASALYAQCQCYGGEEPTKESCNGIDDDCDGQVDENSECCSAGETRTCGTDIGICEKGVSICGENYLWESCITAVKAAPHELCGNEQDDNCDGKTDKYDAQCDACLNGIQDEYEAGVDCGGPCAMPCIEIPWLIIAAAAAFVIVIIMFIIYPSMKRRTIEIEGL
ncbi:MAG: DUF2341 domain-containing protein [Nanoarchaeota archaeon]